MAFFSLKHNGTTQINFEIVITIEYTLSHYILANYSIRHNF